MESEIYTTLSTPTFPSEEAKSMAGGDGSVRRYKLAVAIFPSISILRRLRFAVLGFRMELIVECVGTTVTNPA